METVVFEVERNLLGPGSFKHVVVMSGVIRIPEVCRDELLGRPVYFGEGRDLFVFVQCLIHF